MSVAISEAQFAAMTSRKPTAATVTAPPACDDYKRGRHDVPAGPGPLGVIIVRPVTAASRMFNLEQYRGEAYYVNPDGSLTAAEWEEWRDKVKRENFFCCAGHALRGRG